MATKTKKSASKRAGKTRAKKSLTQREADVLLLGMPELKEKYGFVKNHQVYTMRTRLQKRFGSLEKARRAAKNIGRQGGEESGQTENQVGTTKRTAAKRPGAKRKAQGRIRTEPLRVEREKVNEHDRSFHLTIGGVEIQARGARSASYDTEHKTIRFDI